jgi:hypothetical protein
MDGCARADRAWLTLVEFFRYEDVEVLLARYILFSIVPHGHTRTFSEHLLVATSGINEYTIRRCLGHWQTMGMAKQQGPPTRPVVLSKITCNFKRHKFTGLNLTLFVQKQTMINTRIERCAQEWHIDMNTFTSELYNRIAWMRWKQNKQSSIACGCEIYDATQHIPNDDCSALTCLICNQCVQETLQTNVYDTPIIEALGEFESSHHSTLWLLPPVPESLRCRQKSERNDEECEDDLWEEAGQEALEGREAEQKQEGQEAEEGQEELGGEENVLFTVQGVAKMHSELTQEDLESMSIIEYEKYFNYSEVI